VNDLNVAALQFIYEALVDKVAALASQRAASKAEADVWFQVDQEQWEIANERGHDQQVQIDILQDLAARMKSEQMYADNPV
jgi:hypothetical protein